MPATDLSAQSDISEIGILVGVLKFDPKARDLTQLLLFCGNLRGQKKSLPIPSNYSRSLDFLDNLKALEISEWLP